MTKDFEELNDSLGSFESSRVSSASQVTLVRPEAEVVLLAVDGSGQDTTAIAFAAELAGRLGARVVVTCAVDPKTGDRASVVERAMQALAAGRTPIAASAEAPTAAAPAAQILASIATSGADVVVAPAPYGEELAVGGDESLGFAIDIMLAEIAVPLALVRQPMADPRACFEHLVVPVHVAARACGTAASWAFRLVDPGGTLEVVSVADPRARDDDETDVPTTDELLRAHRVRIGNLVAAVQRRGSEARVDVRVEVEVGRTIERLLAHAGSSPSLLCATLPSDRNSLAFHRAQDLVLGASYPVLLVRPGGAVPC
ncbi:MAG TPA: universal stress protein [Nannocystaceae bacterium]|nr:universal stress protein [Nannocystaceae bacterium]